MSVAAGVAAWRPPQRPALLLRSRTSCCCCGPRDIPAGCPARPHARRTIAALLRVRPTTQGLPQHGERACATWGARLGAAHSLPSTRARLMSRATCFPCLSTSFPGAPQLADSRKPSACTATSLVGPPSPRSLFLCPFARETSASGDRTGVSIDGRVQWTGPRPKHDPSRGGTPPALPVLLRCGIRPVVGGRSF